MPRTIHITLGSDAAARYEAGVKQNPEAARSLRAWLLRAFSDLGVMKPEAPSLFSTPIEVDDDLPPLLEALSLVTNRTRDELVDAWLLETPQDEFAEQKISESAGSADNGSSPTRLSMEKLEKLAGILAMGETLFEWAVKDAQEKLGGEYPDGEEALKTNAEIYRGLRALLGLQAPDTK
jgi:hypothetical protein